MAAQSKDTAFSKLEHLPVRIFIGSWNMGYHHFKRRDFLYGSASGDHADVEIMSNSSAHSDGSGDASSKMEEKDEPDEENASEFDGAISDTELVTHLFKQRLEQPLKDWIVPFYDVYIIAFQESMSEQLVEAISVFIDFINKLPFTRLLLGGTKIKGYGDGAFPHMKHTSLVAWVKNELLATDAVTVLGSRKSSFGLLKGSKGAVSIALKIYSQSICFIGCHLPASSVEDRNAACLSILTSFLRDYTGYKVCDMGSVFHHIVWIGDFNFRVCGIDLVSAMNYLRKMELNELFAYDELSLGSNPLVKLGFTEGAINFPPSYKKIVGRSFVDIEDIFWPEKEYQTKFMQKWYKPAQKNPRIPSWTDRILCWSCEELKGCLKCHVYAAIRPRTHSPLSRSDHSPIMGGLIMHGLPKNRANGVISEYPDLLPIIENPNQIKSKGGAYDKSRKPR